jgi:hypothetical protein
VLEILLSKIKKFVPNLMFFGSQEAVKKIGPKIGFSMHLKLLTERNTHCTVKHKIES